MLMTKVINSLYFYLLVPAYSIIILLFALFNVPTTFYPGILAYFLIVSFPLLVYATRYSTNMALVSAYQNIKISNHHQLVISIFALFIFLCGPLDIYVNGFKLLNPASYTDIPGIGRFIRHFTLLTWILIPLAFMYCENKSTKICLISYALIFPILIIDRNRLLLSFYTFILLWIITNKSNKSVYKWLVYSIPLLIILIFSIIGHYRSGHQVIVPTSHNVLLNQHLPLNNLFMNLPSIMQQVLLYLITPLWNFATIVQAHFTNPDFLLSQLSPFSRESFELHPFAPVLVPRFNVGTELYPFLLYGGLPLAFIAYIGIFILFLLIINLFKKYPNIFTLLIFIKCSFIVLFLGFAPQFYILLNGAFIFLMLALWFGAELLTKFPLLSKGVLLRAV